MIDLARTQVPGATDKVRDMLDLRVGEYRVDALVAFYAIFQTPRDRTATSLTLLGGPSTRDDVGHKVRGRKRDQQQSIGPHTWCSRRTGPKRPETVWPPCTNGVGVAPSM